MPGIRATDDSPRPRVAEFFAGIGLVRLALERQGCQIVFANDLDADKFAMYRDNFGSADFHFGDIHAVSAAQIPDCDWFTASFPCNDLSIAGAGRGLAGEQSSAFWGLIRILDELGERRPPLVLLENVVGFLQSHGGRDFQSALEALNGLGYAVDAMILNARHWTPQSRARLFVIAMQSDEPAGLKLLADSEARPAALARFIHAHSQIRFRFLPLPKLPAAAAKLTDILEDLPPHDAQWWSAERADYFFSQLSDRHLNEANRMLAGSEFSFATAFRRVRSGRSMAELRTDGIAGCLRTPRGGSGRQILFKAGRGRFQVRLLTARECARLQGVPDSFQINATLNKALFGFGDAVCVPAVEWIAEHCLWPQWQKLSTMSPCEAPAP